MIGQCRATEVAATQVGLGEAAIDVGLVWTLADIELTAYAGQRVRLGYVTGNVRAFDCQGDVVCDRTEPARERRAARCAAGGQSQ